MPDTDAKRLSFPKMEHEILDFWRKNNTFQRSLERTQGGKLYTFYDGPPFATGLPHHGNLLASVIKDVIPRYWTMQGRYVERRFGWDCHGLPVEHEIDKSLGVSAHEALSQLGVKGYNDACRAIVSRYTQEWQSIIERIGRWVDFDNQYKTMDVDFMESVWWVFKQLWEKGYIYRGNKVMPVSTSLETPLSNFEASSNYKDVQDPAITVLFKLQDEDASIAAWTTTPWTLPSNLALCVGTNITYVKVFDPDKRIHFYLAQERLDYYQERLSLEVISHCQGSELVGKSYVPLFPYFAEKVNEGAFTVFSDDYVTTEEGTGIVHQAPAFGEDDYRIAQERGMGAFVRPVTMDGRFTDEVADFAEQHVKDADKHIVRYLRDNGSLLLHETIQHSYPYCYRSDTPLIYCAVPSWFIEVEAVKQSLLDCNQEVKWVPNHIRDGRFGNWLENARDWAISRNRIWGTPLPLWENSTTGNILCMGSLEEVERYTGVQLEDLHREYVDDLSFQLPGEEGDYRRVPEVLDCWFESGSMPYAQQHYPFDNSEVFEQGFPADFIAEGIDQTRGWFYTLMVLSSALYEKPAFKNVIVNGLVLAEDGRKMSKHLGNYTDPVELMDRYGADALRLYLINSGLVRAEEQRFLDEGVEAIVRRALIPWYNAYSFFKLYADIDDWSTDQQETEVNNILDRWLMSKLQSFKQSVATELEEYRLYGVVPLLFDFIDDLNNGYIRLNRSRFWAEGSEADKLAAYTVLHKVLYELAQTLAPCAPFFTEFLFQQLGQFDRANSQQSVHLSSFPAPDEKWSDTPLESAVSRMLQILVLGRRKREQHKVNLRIPLRNLTIVHRDQEVLDQLRQLEPYISSELNVKHVTYDNKETDYIRFYAKPNFPVLGKRLGKQLREYQSLISSLNPEQLEQLQKEGSIELNGLTFSEDEIQVFREATEGSNIITDRLISIALDMDVDDELALEGLAREAIHRIQLARKQQNFNVTDRIDLKVDGSKRVLEALAKHEDYISRETLAQSYVAQPTSMFVEDIDGEELRFDIKRRAVA